MAENDGRYGEYFAARMALRAIQNVVVFTRSEVGAPHGKTHEETQRDTKLSDLTSVPGQESEERSTLRGVGGPRFDVIKVMAQLPGSFGGCSFARPTDGLSTSHAMHAQWFDEAS